MARRNRASALKNADSFCYFTQDAAESGASVAPAAPLPTGPPAYVPTYVRPTAAPRPAYVPVRPYGGYTPGSYPSYPSYPSGGSTYYQPSRPSRPSYPSYSNPSRPYAKPWLQKEGDSATEE